VPIGELCFLWLLGSCICDFMTVWAGIYNDIPNRGIIQHLHKAYGKMNTESLIYMMVTNVGVVR